MSASSRPVSLRYYRAGRLREGGLLEIRNAADFPQGMWSLTQCPDLSTLRPQCAKPLAFQVPNIATALA